MKKQFKAAVTFGRFNLLHRGHALLFETMGRAADTVYIGVSNNAKNLPTPLRKEVIGKVCQDSNLDYYLKSGNQPFQVFSKLAEIYQPEEVVAFFGVDQAPLAEAVSRVYGWHTETIARLTSSTAIRGIVDNEEWDLLARLVPPCILNEVVNLRYLENQVTSNK